MDVNILVAMAAASYVAWGIGSGDETMAPLAGSGVVTVRTAALLGGVISFLGAVLLGDRVETTIGKNLLLIRVAEPEVVIMLLSVATWVTLGSYLGLPISVTHSSVGSAIGLGLAKGGFGSVAWGSLSVVAIAWIASPLASLAGAMGLARLFRWFLRRRVAGLRHMMVTMRYSSLLLLFWVSLTSFSGGANNIASATAFLSVASGYDPLLIRALVASPMALGLYMLGRRVLRSVGLNVVELNPVSSLAVQVSAALTIFTGVLIGLPLSVTQILVGAIAGLGLEEGIWLNIRGLRGMIYAWISTFFVSAAIAAAAYFLVSLL